MGLELIGSVSRAMLVALLPAAVLGGLAAGWSGAAGAAAGCLVSLARFRWLAHGVRRGVTGSRRAASGLAAGLRHLALFAALAGLLWAGVHPVALLAGLSVLPPLLIGLGLRAARLPS